ncbi:MAG: hypothetical protein LC623_09215 [Halobacteriales archaeon]|nr:hypothetical protein [Halobacteriales archaeon]
MAVDALRTSIRDLHASKSAAYGNAWKKRGEVLSVLANLARKIDRLEVLAAQGVQLAGEETVLDTALDLFVYALKYQSYLADLDENVAAVLFPASMRHPFSEDTQGFDYLLRTHKFVAGNPWPMAVQDISYQFQRIEACFTGLQPRSGVQARFVEAQKLADLAGALVRTLSPPTDTLKNSHGKVSP